MKVQTSVRVEESSYKQAKRVFDRFGLSFADAVNLFLSKVAIDQAIPFEISLPEDEKCDNLSNRVFEKICDNEEDEAYDAFLAV